MTSGSETKRLEAQLKALEEECAAILSRSKDVHASSPTESVHHDPTDPVEPVTFNSGFAQCEPFQAKEPQQSDEPLSPPQRSRKEIRVDGVHGYYFRQLVKNAPMPISGKRQHELASALVGRPYNLPLAWWEFLGITEDEWEAVLSECRQADSMSGCHMLKGAEDDVEEKPFAKPADATANSPEITGYPRIDLRFRLKPLQEIYTRRNAIDPDNENAIWLHRYYIQCAEQRECREGIPDEERGEIGVLAHNAFDWRRILGMWRSVEGSKQRRFDLFFAPKGHCGTAAALRQYEMGLRMGKWRKSDGANVENGKVVKQVKRKADGTLCTLSFTRGNKKVKVDVDLDDLKEYVQKDIEGYLEWKGAVPERQGVSLSQWRGKDS